MIKTTFMAKPGQDRTQMVQVVDATDTSWTPQQLLLCISRRKEPIFTPHTDIKYCNRSLKS